MSLNLILPFLSSLVMLIFVIFVLQRYVTRRKSYFLFWGIGLGMFGAASFSEAYLAIDWSPWTFFTWYLFGAVLTAAWIGHGTLLLLVRQKWVNLITAILVLGSLSATFLMFKAMPTLDVDIFTTERPISGQYKTQVLKSGQVAPEGTETTTVECRGEQVAVVRGILPCGSPVRLATIFFNIYGTLTLVGGAIWSAYLFWRKRVLPNRVIGNILIATGGLLIASASTLTRLGYGQYLYIAELLSGIIMFSGFLLTSKPGKAEPETT